MVAKDPNDRFANISEAITALENLAKTTLLNDLRPKAPFEVAAGVDTDKTSIRPQEVNADPASTAVTATRGIVAVLVEPSRTQANIIARYLEQMGISTVHITKSGREALEIARREKANFIVSSMHLSDMTGVQLAQAMLADASCNNMLFVLATSASETDEAHQIVGPRVSLLPKPFDLHRLETAFESLLS
jgi:CheY-like chemotaxis protein